MDNQELKRTERGNKITFVAINIILVFCLLSLIPAENMEMKTKIISVGIIVFLFIFFITTFFVKINVNIKKYIFTIVSASIIPLFMYLQNGSIDNTYLFFCVIGLTSIYSDFIFMLVVSGYAVLINISLYIVASHKFFPALDGGQFITYCATLLVTGVLISNAVKSNIKLLKESKDKEEKLKTLLNKSQDMSNVIDDSVQQLAHMVKEISESNKVVSKVISSVTEGSTIQIEKANEGLEVGNKLIESTEEIRKSANSMKESALQVISISEKGTESIVNLHTMNEKNQTTMNDVNHVVQELIQKTNEISEFSKTILEIARETKLLAFNALVESARAGETGKGFSVIAQNINKLATLSDMKAKEIQTTISGIIEVSKETVDKLETSNKVSDEQKIIVGETTEIFKTFKDSTSESINEINNMYSKIGQLIEIRDTVVNSINEISKVTESNSAMVEEVMATFEEEASQMAIISSYTQKLKEESEKVRTLIDTLEMN